MVEKIYFLKNSDNIKFGDDLKSYKFLNLLNLNDSNTRNYDNSDDYKNDNNLEEEEVLNQNVNLNKNQNIILDLIKEENKKLHDKIEELKNIYNIKKKYFEKIKFDKIKKNEILIQEKNDISQKTVSSQEYEKHLNLSLKNIYILNNSLEVLSYQINNLSNLNIYQENENFNNLKNVINELVLQKEEELNYIKNKENMIKLKEQKNEIILEEISDELANIKKDILNFENKNNLCNKKWESINDENNFQNFILEKFKMQLDRQNESNKTLFPELDNNFYEIHKNYEGCINNIDDSNVLKYSADIIINVINEVQTQNEDFSITIKDLEENLNMIDEQIKLKKEDLQSINDTISCKLVNPILSNKLKSSLDKYYELKDYYFELKKLETHIEDNNINNLLINSLKTKLSDKQLINNELINKIKDLKTDKNLWNNDDFYIQISNKITEFDKQNLILKNENDELKSKFSSIDSQCQEFEKLLKIKKTKLENNIWINSKLNYQVNHNFRNNNEIFIEKHVINNNI